MCTRVSFALRRAPSRCGAFGGGPAIDEHRTPRGVLRCRPFSGRNRRTRRPLGGVRTALGSGLGRSGPVASRHLRIHLCGCTAGGIAGQLATKIHTGSSTIGKLPWSTFARAHQANRQVSRAECKSGLYSD